MNTALVLIDIQNDYFKGGKNELVDSEKSVIYAKKALDLFRRNNFPIIHVQHISIHKGSSFFIPNTEGVKIHSEVYPLENEKVITKNFPDSFLNTELEQYLKQIKINKLVICGMMSHMCIDTTVRSAKRLGYEMILLDDACTTKDLEWKNVKIPAKIVHNSFMASLHGGFANVIDTNSLQDIICIE